MQSNFALQTEFYQQSMFSYNFAEENVFLTDAVVGLDSVAYLLAIQNTVKLFCSAIVSLIHVAKISINYPRLNFILSKMSGTKRVKQMSKNLLSSLSTRN